MSQYKIFLQLRILPYTYTYYNIIYNTSYIIVAENDSDCAKIIFSFILVRNVQKKKKTQTVNRFRQFIDSVMFMLFITNIKEVICLNNVTYYILQYVFRLESTIRYITKKKKDMKVFHV